MWTPEGENETDLIPAHVTRVMKVGRELRIFFSGKEGEYGDKFEGVLSIRLRLGTQKIKGNQSYKHEDDEWELVPYSVIGKFDDRRFETFSGTWTEQGTRCRVDVLGLPPTVNPAAKRKKAAKARKSRKRRASR